MLREILSLIRRAMDHVLWVALFNRVWESVIFKSFLRCDAIFVIISSFGFFQALFLWFLFGYNSSYLLRLMISLLHPIKENIDCQELEAADENLFEVLDELNQVEGSSNCLERVRQILSQPIVRIRNKENLIQDLNRLNAMQPNLLAHMRLLELADENNEEEKTFLMGFDLMKMLSGQDFRILPGNRNTVLSVPGVYTSKHFTPRMRGAFSHYWNTLDVHTYGRLHNISYGSKTICGCGQCETIGKIYYQSGDKNHVFFCPSYAEYTGQVDSTVRVTIQNCRQKISYEPWIEYIFPDYTFKKEYLPIAVLIERGLLRLPEKFILKPEQEINNMSGMIDFFLSRQGYTKDPNVIKHIITSILSMKFSYPEGVSKTKRSSFKRLYLLIKLALEDFYETKFRSKISYYIERKYKDSISSLKINIKPKEETYFAISDVTTKVVEKLKVECFNDKSEIMTSEDLKKQLEVNEKFEARKAELIAKYKLLDVAAGSLASVEYPIQHCLAKEITTYTTDVSGVTLVWVESSVRKARLRSRKGKRRGENKDKDVDFNNKVKIRRPTGEINKDTPTKVLYDLYVTLEKAKLARNRSFKIHKLNRMLSYGDFCHNLEKFTNYKSNTLNAVRFLSGRAYEPFRKSCINKVLKRSKKCIKIDSRNHVEYKHYGRTVKNIYQIVQSKVDEKRSRKKNVTESEVLSYLKNQLSIMNSSVLIDDVIRDLIDISKIDFE
jgi:hypothetical protein